MLNPINDITGQARQGSVAAIIQVLNEQLADSGVRARAMFADGNLQLLCEAAKVEQLQQSNLVQKIRQILESISPRNIRRVNINSRIVREQQLLWLEEITRDPENQLLWSEEIILAKPNLFQQLAKDLREQRNEPKKITFSNSQSSRRLVRRQNQVGRRILGGASASLFLLLLTWTVYSWLGGKFSQTTHAGTLESLPSSANIPSSVNKSEAIAPSTPPQPDIINKLIAPSTGKQNQSEDAFASAVRIANVASASGKIAKTPSEWLDLSAQWQHAADLMETVPNSYSRYSEAQSRTKLYREYSQTAAQKAHNK
jgi:hypothetical protein